MTGAAAESAAFRFQKEINRDDAKKETILAVTLDSDVYANTRRGFPDLRVFNAQGREVPYVIEKVTEPKTHSVRTACGSKVISLKEQEDGLDILVRLDADAPAADGLSIDTPLTNYERRASVFGSNDGKDWTPLVAGALVFDYSRYMDVSNHEIRLPKNRFRQFRIRIAGIADAKESPFLDLTRKYRDGSEAERTEKTVLERRPFRIDGIEFWHEKNEKISECDRKTEYKVDAGRIEEDSAKKTTLIHVVTHGEPLTELTLETSSRNFCRAAEVQKAVPHGVRTEWVTIGQGNVLRIDLGDYHKENLGLLFPEHRETDYRIVIRNEDNPPLTITGVKSRGNVYRAVFLAAANETYRLGYGSDEADEPKYDAAIVLAPLRQGHATTTGRLGIEVKNPAATKCSACPLRGLANNPVFLGAIVVVLVAVLGWALYRATRRIDQLPKDT
jgi:hypothetical protein